MSLLMQIQSKKIRIYTILLTLITSNVETRASYNSFSHKHSQDTKILCIGDSITQGGTIGRAEYTYRLPLQELISNKGYKVDFIGSRQVGLHENFAWPKGFDLDHEGFYSKTTNYISNALITDFKKIESPDIAIIHVGSNDEDSIFKHKIINPTVDMIGQLREKNPKVKILIIQIPGKYKYFYTHIWNWWISKCMSSNQSPIMTVDLNDSWKLSHHKFDGIHPNIEGRKFMANLIFSKLQFFLM